MATTDDEAGARTVSRAGGDATAGWENIEHAGYVPPATPSPEPTCVLCGRTLDNHHGVFCQRSDDDPAGTQRFTPPAINSSRTDSSLIVADDATLRALAEDEARRWGPEDDGFDGLRLLAAAPFDGMNALHYFTRQHARQLDRLLREHGEAQRLYLEACGERDALAMHSPGDRMREAVTAYLAAKDAYENRDTRALADAWWAADAALRSTLSPTEDA